MANDLTPISDEVIGKGIVFPFQLDSSGKVPIVGGIELIRASIISILAFPFGFRYFLGEFGVRTWELLEEPNDEFLLTLAKKFIVESIIRWEHRIEQLEVPEITVTETSINIRLKYKVKTTGLEDSFTYPYYTNITT